MRKPINRSCVPSGARYWERYSDYSRRTYSSTPITLRGVINDFKLAIGDQLRAARERLGMSQEELADRAGVDRTYVSILERGLKSPTLETFERVCAALDTLPERVIEAARRK